MAGKQDAEGEDGAKIFLALGDAGGSKKREHGEQDQQWLEDGKPGEAEAERADGKQQHRCRGCKGPGLRRRSCG